MEFRCYFRKHGKIIWGAGSKEAISGGEPGAPTSLTEPKNLQALKGVDVKT